MLLRNVFAFRLGSSSGGLSLLAQAFDDLIPRPGRTAGGVPGLGGLWPGGGFGFLRSKFALLVAVTMRLQQRSGVAAIY